MPSPSYLRLGPVLARQHGVFTVGQAAEAGIGRSTLRRMRSRREIERLYPSVYASALFPDSSDRRWMAIQLLAGDTAAISHLAAAHVHGLHYTGTRRRPDLELTVPRGRHVRSLPVRVHTHVRLTDAAVTVADGWRVTRVAWTLASLTHRLGAARAEQAVGSAIANGDTTIRAVAACVPLFWACPGVEALRDIVSRLDPRIRLTVSEAERLALRIVLAAGLPPPEVNHRVIDAAGRVRRLDLAWPAWGVCIEIDVHPSHDGTIGRHRDGRRQNDLVGDWTVLRFDDLDLQFDREHVLAVIRRTLRAAGAPV